MRRVGKGRFLGRAHRPMRKRWARLQKTAFLPTLQNKGKTCYKKNRTKKTGLRWLWITVTVMILDRLTKYLALQYLPPYAEVPIVKYFNLTLAYNKGAAFSFLNTASGWQGFMFGGIALLVSIVH